jgi:hypothetical protein
MSKKPKKRVVDLTNLPKEKLKEMSNIQLNDEKMDTENESMLKIQFIKVPEERDTYSTRVELKGNISNLIEGVAKAVEHDETIREVMFEIVDSLMMSRLNYFANKNGFVDDEVDLDKDPSGIVPMGKGADA